jgi:PPK2 family polyphosphate:nucleotide phosphotransferase
MPSAKDAELEDIIDRFRIKAGTKVRLKDHDPGWEGDRELPKDERKQLARQVLSEKVASLAMAQELLYAADSWSVLVILQALDAAGKDSTIKHVMSGVNPQGCQVYSFKHPSAEELNHTFLWRCTRVLPARGQIGIFNRSYYEEVLIVKVHQDLVHAQRIPDANPVRKKFWRARYKDINNLEKHLTRNGTVVIKFFLHISKEEQRKRFLQRINNESKHWKFSPSDLAERSYWDDYMNAYEEMLTETSTTWAPWYVVPADHKWVTRALVAAIAARTIGSLGLSYPEVTPEKRRQIEEAKRQLEEEGKDSSA